MTLASKINKYLGVPLFDESVNHELQLNSLTRKQVIQWHCEDLISLKTLLPTERLIRYVNEIKNQLEAK